MSTLKMCRLWCVHSELKNDGDLAICSACGCPHLFQGDHVVPKDMAKEECDCDDCKRDLWRLRPSTLPLQMPWRHEGERLQMWARNAKSWLADFKAEFGERHANHSPSCDAIIRAAVSHGAALKWLQSIPGKVVEDLARLADERDQAWAVANAHLQRCNALEWDKAEEATSARSAKEECDRAKVHLRLAQELCSRLEQERDALLKACKALVSAWNAPTGYGVSRQMDDAEALALAAIAKAEGRQP